MGYSYKGSLSFGLIYIPIQLTNSIRNNDISFNMLEKTTMSRVQYKKTCVDCNNQEIDTKNIVKGYQYEEGKYVIFEDADFEKIKSKKDKSITIENFVNIEEIDPLYYDKPYYVVPTGAFKAFALLKKAMEEENKVGIAKTVLGNKETLIMIRVKENQMYLNTMYFDEEVLRNPYQDIKEAIDPKELKLAKAIIENMTTPFQPTQYHDEYRQKVIEAIDLKIKGKEIIAPVDKEINQISSLMEALEKSLKSTAIKGKKGTAPLDVEVNETVKKNKRTKKEVGEKMSDDKVTNRKTAKEDVIREVVEREIYPTSDKRTKAAIESPRTRVEAEAKKETTTRNTSKKNDIEVDPTLTTNKTTRRKNTEA